MNWELSTRISLENDRVPKGAAERQERTAAEILRRLEDQPGLVLADEVGMGKTYVALAVAVSVIEATGGKQPVVVMVPPSVADKWPREWEVFQDRCLRPGSVIRAPSECVRRGSEFLKLLDDPRSRRNNLIFLTHGALTHQLTDPFVKLAIVRQAFLRRSSLAQQKRAFARWAGKIIEAQWRLRFPTLAEELLNAPIGEWRRIYENVTGKALDDDPVPRAIQEALTEIDVSSLRESLSKLPTRASKNLEQRLSPIRRDVRRALAELWKECLGGLRIHMPLLIMDEAHHLKNPQTNLAGLFATKEAEQDANLLRGPLSGAFDRMLFLTATPFQLGHHELIEVLKRFRGIRWAGLDREAFQEQLEELERGLTGAQTAALRLDRLWGNLELSDLAGQESGWWRFADDLPQKLRDTASAISETKARMQIAEDLLQPWVIRHARSDKDSRRSVKPGAAIREGGDPRRGIEVSGPVILPFLLAARTQAVVAQEGHRANERTRAFFAEGLASSFEAYRETRSRQEHAVDELEETSQPLSDEALWYLDQIDHALPPDDEEVWAEHPKIQASVQRAADLWDQGEKVLLFCFYIATGKALRAHISHEIEKRLLKRGAEVLGLSPDDPETIRANLDQIGDRFFVAAAPVTRKARRLIDETLADFALEDALRNEMVDIVLRFLRTPSFLVRYLDLSAPPLDALEAALNQRDPSARSLTDKIRAFGEFMEQRVDSERAELIDALDGIQTGTIFSADSTAFEPGERAARRDRRIPNVRLANGEVSRELRRRLMLAFNTPFFPEVLIASSVMAEGVDLHLDCRHVIHHDLDWNPSVLEQRTGRLDRIGSKAEVTKQPILIYEPFLEGTQDERQYRVVKDRERWFNVVMGESLQLDEWRADKLAERVLLPAELAKELTLHLQL